MCLTFNIMIPFICEITFVCRINANTTTILARKLTGVFFLIFLEGAGVENGGRENCAIYAMFQKENIFVIHEQSWTKALNIFFIADILILTNEMIYDIEPETFWAINYAIFEIDAIGSNITFVSFIWW